MTSPSDDGARGSNAPDAFSPDLQPPQMPEKVTIRKKDKAKYSQEEEHVTEGEYNVQEEGSDIAKPVKFGSNIATLKWIEGKIDYNYQQIQSLKTDIAQLNIASRHTNRQLEDMSKRL